jgi:TatD DNase family protein
VKKSLPGSVWVNNMIFDSHCHLNDEALFFHLQEHIDKAINAKVTYMLIVGFDLQTSKRAIEIAEKYSFIYAAVALHPNEIMNAKNGDYEAIVELAKHKKVVAVGEIGLDYHWKNTPVDIQKEYFLKFLKVAKEINKPIIIHTRDSLDDTLSFLNDNRNLLTSGVMHCFSGNVAMARKFIDLGFYISLAGPLTFKNAKETKQVAQMISLDNLMVETDAPYLAPHPYRGKLNEPALIVHVVDELSKLKNLEYQFVAETTAKNAKKLFGIK